VTLNPDPAFPHLHGRPPYGWVNDPNGCSYVDGRFHVFFQYNPAAPVHEAIQWAHVSSTDLVRWRPEPVALVPRPGELDAHGCWTGCVTDDGGVPTAVYSAVAGGDGRSEAVLARSDRTMRSWEPARTSAVGMPEDPAISDVRDPYLFEYDGRRYAIQGAGRKRGTPQVLLYDASDLTSWVPLGALLHGDDPLAARVAPAHIWECPNLVEIDGRWVLVLSLWRGDEGSHTLAGVRYLVGDLVPRADGHPAFEPVAGGEVDCGPCFYAPQVLPVDGRALVWAWSWEHGRTAAQIEAAGWAGALTFCRELSLDGDALVSRPAPELAALRRGACSVPSGSPVEERAFEVELPPGPGALWLVHPDREELVTEWTVPPEPVTQPRVLVDGSMVEVFAGGPRPLTTRGYPTRGSHWRVTSSATEDLRVWRLGLD
jgi:beta-fructofuranosidase